MVSHFERIVMKDVGLRGHPHWQDAYFAYYKRFLYIAPTEDAALFEKARQAAATLQLGLDYHCSGYGNYMAFLHNLCRRCQQSVAAS